MITSNSMLKSNLKEKARRSSVLVATDLALQSRIDNDDLNALPLRSSLPETDLFSRGSTGSSGRRQIFRHFGAEESRVNFFTLAFQDNVLELAFRVYIVKKSAYRTRWACYGFFLTSAILGLLEFLFHFTGEALDVQYNILIIRAVTCCLMCFYALLVSPSWRPRDLEIIMGATFLAHGILLAASVRVGVEEGVSSLYPFGWWSISFDLVHCAITQLSGIRFPVAAIVAIAHPLIQSLNLLFIRGPSSVGSDIEFLLLLLGCIVSCLFVAYRREHTERKEFVSLINVNVDKRMREELLCDMLPQKIRETLQYGKSHDSPTHTETNDGFGTSAPGGVGISVTKPSQVVSAVGSASDISGTLGNVSAPLYFPPHSPSGGSSVKSSSIGGHISHDSHSISLQGSLPLTSVPLHLQQKEEALRNSSSPSTAFLTPSDGAPGSLSTGNRMSPAPSTSSLPTQVFDLGSGNEGIISSNKSSRRQSMADIEALLPDVTYSSSIGQKYVHNATDNVTGRSIGGENPLFETSAIIGLARSSSMISQNAQFHSTFSTGAGPHSSYPSATIGDDSRGKRTRPIRFPKRSSNVGTLTGTPSFTATPRMGFLEHVDPRFADNILDANEVVEGQTAGRFEDPSGVGTPSQNGHSTAHGSLNLSHSHCNSFSNAHSVLSSVNSGQNLLGSTVDVGNRRPSVSAHAKNSFMSSESSGALATTRSSNMMSSQPSSQALTSATRPSFVSVKASVSNGGLESIRVPVNTTQGNNSGSVTPSGSTLSTPAVVISNLNALGLTSPTLPLKATNEEIKGNEIHPLYVSTNIGSGNDLCLSSQASPRLAHIESHDRYSSESDDDNQHQINNATILSSPSALFSADGSPGASCVLNGTENSEANLYPIESTRETTSIREIPSTSRKDSGFMNYESESSPDLCTHSSNAQMNHLIGLSSDRTCDASFDVTSPSEVSPKRTDLNIHVSPLQEENSHTSNVAIAQTSPLKLSDPTTSDTPSRPIKRGSSSSLPNPDSSTLHHHTINIVSLESSHDGAPKHLNAFSSASVFIPSSILASNRRGRSSLPLSLEVPRSQDFRFVDALRTDGAGPLVPSIEANQLLPSASITSLLSSMPTTQAGRRGGSLIGTQRSARLSRSSRELTRRSPSSSSPASSFSLSSSRPRGGTLSRIASHFLGRDSGFPFVGSTSTRELGHSNNSTSSNTLMNSAPAPGITLPRIAAAVSSSTPHQGSGDSSSAASLQAHSSHGSDHASVSPSHRSNRAASISRTLSVRARAASTLMGSPHSPNTHNGSGSNGFLSTFGNGSFGSPRSPVHSERFSASAVSDIAQDSQLQRKGSNSNNNSNSNSNSNNSSHNRLPLSSAAPASEVLKKASRSLASMGSVVSLITRAKRLGSMEIPQDDGSSVPSGNAATVASSTHEGNSRIAGMTGKVKTDPRDPSSLFDDADEAVGHLFESVSVMFVYISNMNRLAARASPVDLVGFLNKLYSSFDDIVEAQGVYKIMAVANMYLCVAGALDENDHHAATISDTALRIMKFVARRRSVLQLANLPVEIQIGIHSGPAAAGVIGTKSFNWHIFGDTVNVASRMCSVNEPGRIQISSTTAQYLMVENAKFHERKFGREMYLRVASQPLLDDLDINSLPDNHQIEVSSTCTAGSVAIEPPTTSKVYSYSANGILSTKNENSMQSSVEKAAHVLPLSVAVPIDHPSGISDLNGLKGSVVLDMDSFSNNVSLPSGSLNVVTDADTASSSTAPLLLSLVPPPNTHAATSTCVTEPLSVRVSREQMEYAPGMNLGSPFSLSSFGSSASASASASPSVRNSVLRTANEHVPSPNSIHLDGMFRLRPRGPTHFKGKGLLETYWLSDAKLDLLTAHIAQLNKLAAEDKMRKRALRQHIVVNMNGEGSGISSSVLLGSGVVGAPLHGLSIPVSPDVSMKGQAQAQGSRSPFGVSLVTQGTAPLLHSLAALPPTSSAPPAVPGASAATGTSSTNNGVQKGFVSTLRNLFSSDSGPRSPSLSTSQLPTPSFQISSSHPPLNIAVPVGSPSSMSGMGLTPVRYSLGFPQFGESPVPRVRKIGNDTGDDASAEGTPLSFSYSPVSNGTPSKHVQGALVSLNTSFTGATPSAATQAVLSTQISENVAPLGLSEEQEEAAGTRPRRKSMQELSAREQRRVRAVQLDDTTISSPSSSSVHIAPSLLIAAPRSPVSPQGNRTVSTSPSSLGWTSPSIRARSVDGSIRMNSFMRAVGPSSDSSSTPRDAPPSLRTEAVSNPLARLAAASSAMLTRLSSHSEVEDPMFSLQSPSPRMHAPVGSRHSLSSPSSSTACGAVSSSTAQGPPAAMRMMQRRSLSGRISVSQRNLVKPNEAASSAAGIASRNQTPLAEPNTSAPSFLRRLSSSIGQISPRVSPRAGSAPSRSELESEHQPLGFAFSVSRRNSAGPIISTSSRHLAVPPSGYSNYSYPSLSASAAPAAASPSASSNSGFQAGLRNASSFLGVFTAAQPSVDTSGNVAMQAAMQLADLQFTSFGHKSPRAQDTRDRDGKSRSISRMPSQLSPRAVPRGQSHRGSLIGLEGSGGTSVGIQNRIRSQSVSGRVLSSGAKDSGSAPISRKGSSKSVSVLDKLSKMSLFGNSKRTSELSPRVLQSFSGKEPFPLSSGANSQRSLGSQLHQDSPSAAAAELNDSLSDRGLVSQSYADSARPARQMNMSRTVSSSTVTMASHLVTPRAANAAATAEKPLWLPSPALADGASSSSAPVAVAVGLSSAPTSQEVPSKNSVTSVAANSATTSSAMGTLTLQDSARPAAVSTHPTHEPKNPPSETLKSALKLSKPVDPPKMSEFTPSVPPLSLTLSVPTLTPSSNDLSLAMAYQETDSEDERVFISKKRHHVRRSIVDDSARANSSRSNTHTRTTEENEHVLRDHSENDAASSDIEDELSNASDPEAAERDRLIQVKVQPLQPLTLSFLDEELEELYALTGRFVVRRSIERVLFVAWMFSVVVLLASHFESHRFRGDSTAHWTLFACSLASYALMKLGIIDVIAWSRFGRVGVFRFLSVYELLCLMLCVVYTVCLNSELFTVPESTAMHPITALNGLASMNFVLFLVFSFMEFRAYVLVLVYAVCLSLYIGLLLSNHTFANSSSSLHVILALIACVIAIISAYSREIARRNRYVVQEQSHKMRDKCERILLNMLPSKRHADQLMRDESVVEELEDVTMLYSDIKGFTELSSRISPEALIMFLDRLYSAFDQHLQYFDLYKIETIGDAFIVVGGMESTRTVSSSAYPGGTGVHDDPASVAAMAARRRSSIAALMLPFERFANVTREASGYSYNNNNLGTGTFTHSSSYRDGLTHSHAHFLQGGVSATVPTSLPSLGGAAPLRSNSSNQLFGEESDGSTSAGVTTVAGSLTSSLAKSLSFLKVASSREVPHSMGTPAAALTRRDEDPAIVGPGAQYQGARRGSSARLLASGSFLRKLAPLVHSGVSSVGSGSATSSALGSAGPEDPVWTATERGGPAGSSESAVGVSASATAASSLLSARSNMDAGLYRSQSAVNLFAPVPKAKEMRLRLPRFLSRKGINKVAPMPAAGNNASGGAPHAAPLVPPVGFVSTTGVSLNRAIPTNLFVAHRRASFARGSASAEDVFHAPHSSRKGSLSLALGLEKKQTGSTRKSSIAPISLTGITSSIPSSVAASLGATAVSGAGAHHASLKSPPASLHRLASQKSLKKLFDDLNEDLSDTALSAGASSAYKDGVRPGSGRRPLSRTASRPGSRGGSRPVSASAKKGHRQPSSRNLLGALSTKDKDRDDWNASVLTSPAVETIPLSTSASDSRRKGLLKSRYSEPFSQLQSNQSVASNNNNMQGASGAINSTTPASHSLSNFFASPARSLLDSLSAAAVSTSTTHSNNSSSNSLNPAQVLVGPSQVQDSSRTSNPTHIEMDTFRTFESTRSESVLATARNIGTKLDGESVLPTSMEPQLRRVNMSGISNFSNSNNNSNYNLKSPQKNSNDNDHTDMDVADVTGLVSGSPSPVSTPSYSTFSTPSGYCKSDFTNCNSNSSSGSGVFLGNSDSENQSRTSTHSGAAKSSHTSSRTKDLGPMMSYRRRSVATGRPVELDLHMLMSDSASALASHSTSQPPGQSTGTSDSGSTTSSKKVNGLVNIRRASVSAVAYGTLTDKTMNVAPERDKSPSLGMRLGLGFGIGLGRSPNAVSGSGGGVTSPATSTPPQVPMSRLRSHVTGDDSSVVGAPSSAKEKSGTRSSILKLLRGREDSDNSDASSVASRSSTANHLVARPSTGGRSVSQAGGSVVYGSNQNSNTFAVDIHGDSIDDVAGQPANLGLILKSSSDPNYAQLMSQANSSSSSGGNGGVIRKLARRLSKPLGTLGRAGESSLGSPPVSSAPGPSSSGSLIGALTGSPLPVGSLSFSPDVPNSNAHTILAKPLAALRRASSMRFSPPGRGADSQANTAASNALDEYPSSYSAPNVKNVVGRDTHNLVYTIDADDSEDYDSFHVPGGVGGDGDGSVSTGAHNYIEVSPGPTLVSPPGVNFNFNPNNMNVVIGSGVRPDDLADALAALGENAVPSSIQQQTASRGSSQSNEIESGLRNSVVSGSLSATVSALPSVNADSAHISLTNPPVGAVVKTNESASATISSDGYYTDSPLKTVNVSHSNLSSMQTIQPGMIGSATSIASVVVGSANGSGIPNVISPASNSNENSLGVPILLSPSPGAPAQVFLQLPPGVALPTNVPLHTLPNGAVGVLSTDMSMLQTTHSPNGTAVHVGMKPLIVPANVYPPAAFSIQQKALPRMPPPIADVPLELRRPLSHVGAIAVFAMDMLIEVARVCAETGVSVDLRIGVHSGKAVGGIIGKSRPRYFVWGPDTLIANKMESSGVAGGIQVSEGTAKRLVYEGFSVVPHSVVDVTEELGMDLSDEEDEVKGRRRRRQYINTYLLTKYEDLSGIQFEVGKTDEQ